jgi:phage terminase large subunit-like protein
VREAAEASLLTFIKLIAPKRLLGAVHEELIGWWTRQARKSHQMTLLPRDHMKSALIAYRVAWEITRNPAIRVLYISSTAGLAEKQLKFIQDIITSPVYTRYWPTMVHRDEGKREKWTQSEFAVDHPLRREEGIRDATVFTGGLTTSLTGFHCDIAVLDDVVVQENAYTQEGRDKVKTQYSLLASIEGADAVEWVVGTRYHPNDLYSELLAMEEDIYNPGGEVIDSIPIYEVFERQVEDRGDGTGEFLWPRQRRQDGKWFGFSREILSKKRAQYLDKTQFYAQYYNDPNDPGELNIDRSRFQYYDTRLLEEYDGAWLYNGKYLSVVAAVDFAYSTSKRSDYTTIAVLGMDHDSNFYVLELDRFKTTQISEYYDHIFELFRKWGFRRLACEVTAAQKPVVEELKNQYFWPNGLNISIVEMKPTRHEGSKAERIQAVLQNKYDEQMIWHYRGGNCQVLEEELCVKHPPHDDCMDALANAVEISVVPRGNQYSRHHYTKKQNVIFHKRFGGVAVA